MENFRQAGYVVYDHPYDYPDCFVVREWFSLPSGQLVPGKRVMLASTLEEARQFIPGECICFGRTDLDDEKIVETWL
jgi:hypothetical protein